MYMWDCIMIILYYTCYEYFIMICDTIGYCLYWMGEQGRRDGDRPKVIANTPDALACALPSCRRPCRSSPPCPAGGARHPASAICTHLRKQQGIARR